MDLKLLLSPVAYGIPLPAIIEVSNQSGANVSSRKLFTWGDGDKYRLGHGNKDAYLFPTCVSALIDFDMMQLACGHNSLTTSAHVFSMGNNAYGQLGNPQSDGKAPCLVLTLRGDVFAWGRGANGRLGHGDTEDRNVPTLVEALKAQKSLMWIKLYDEYMHPQVGIWSRSVSMQAGFCTKKAIKAALAPTPGKPHRVCDSCYMKLKKAAEMGISSIVYRKTSTTSSRIDQETKTSRVLLPPAMAPVKYLEIKSGGGGLKADTYSIVRESQVPSLVQLRDVAFPSSLSALQYALRPVTLPSSSQPQPQYQSASPYSRRPTVSYAKATHQSSSGTPEVAQMEGQKEVIEQFEPGVYVTIIQLANGTKIFKGVRFRFAEQQAEGWWKENKDRLLKKYSPTKPRRPSAEALPTPADQEPTRQCRKQARLRRFLNEPLASRARTFRGLLVKDQLRAVLIRAGVAFVSCNI
ncbi:hypothetical protein SASPL_113731 [Salvia splendens]|uniref:BRX domain-containing protein n=1 Tax=Salvia splendens TaxID=180675 RepID=A0A8X8Y3B6_SALSN|nr:hypothetical protein SASPL_113731 [Salvia splendens]